MELIVIIYHKEGREGSKLQPVSVKSAVKYMNKMFDSSLCILQQSGVPT